MRKLAPLTRILLVLASTLSIGASMYAPAVAQSPLAKLPAPCKLESPAVYLVVEATRRRIVDWDTFLNLGYKTPDIVPCGAAQQYPEGAPLTRLIKGSTEAVYWMEKGARRHIPDMATFDSLGFQPADISVLPDAIVALWPLGKPLVSRKDLVSVEDQVSLGRYTIQLIKEGKYTFYAVISAPNQTTVKVPYAYKIGKLPAADITGEGDPDVMFLRNNDLLLFGFGTVVYNLGARPTIVLDITQVYHMTTDTGEGEFKDLNGDGVYEFITAEQFNTGWYPSRCLLAYIPAVLRYDSTQKRYGSANRQFPDFFNRVISTAMATPETQCQAVVLLVYLDRTAEAKALFDRLYPGSDKSTWPNLLANVKRARYYTPGSQG